MAVHNRLYACLIAIPLLMAVLAVALTGLGHSPQAVAIVLAAWGLIVFGGVVLAGSAALASAARRNAQPSLDEVLRHR